MNRRAIPSAPLAISLLAAAILAACGGTGNGSDSPSAANSAAAGTAVFEGPISGFGSVVVNGVRFSDSAATVVDEDGASVSRAKLNLGSNVHVEGRADSDKGSGKADRIVLLPDLRGTITAIDTAAGSLTVMGRVVIVGSATVLEGFAALAELTIGDKVEVHGLLDANGQLQASLVEKKVAIASVLVRGTATNVNAGAKTFQIGPLTIGFGAAVIGPDGATVTEGARVSVRAASPPVAGVLSADRIRVKRVSDSLQPAGGFVAVKGLVEAAPDAGGIMRVSGIRVDTSKAKMAGEIAPSAGMRVHVVGSFEGETLVATRVVSDASRRKEGRDLNELHGVVTTAADPTHFVVQGVSVDATSATIVGGGGSGGVIAVGLHVEVDGRVETGASGSVLKATRVEISVKGAVDGDDRDVPADAARSYYGAITDFASIASFKLNGQQVDATGVTDAGRLGLSNGVYIEAKGKLVDGVLLARAIEVKEARLVPTGR